MLVIDFSCGFTDPACALGRRPDAGGRGDAAAARCGPGEGAAGRLHDDRLRDAPKDGGLWLQKVPALADLELDGPWVEIDPRLDPRDDEPIVMKKGASGFFGTNLASILLSQGVDTVDPVRSDDLRLRPGDRDRPAPVRLADDRPPRVRGRSGAGAARGEPVRHPGKVRGRRLRSRTPSPTSRACRAEHRRRRREGRSAAGRLHRAGGRRGGAPRASQRSCPTGDRGARRSGPRRSARPGPTPGRDTRRLPRGGRVLKAPVGDPEFDAAQTSVPSRVMRLREELELYANLRPAQAGRDRPAARPRARRRHLLRRQRGPR